MLIYRCDGCGVILGEADDIYEVRASCRGPVLSGGWREAQGAAIAHLCGRCWKQFVKALKDDVGWEVVLEKEPWGADE